MKNLQEINHSTLVETGIELLKNGDTATKIAAVGIITISAIVYVASKGIQ